MKTYKNVKPKYANEYFGIIGEADDMKAKLREFGSYPPLNYLLAMNFDERIVWDLPEGSPPVKPTHGENPDMFAPLASCIKRIMVCLKSDNRLPAWKKENIFIQVLEGLNEKEQEILVSAKDKALTELYPWLTSEFVSSVYPDYVHKASTWLDKTER